MTTSTEKNIYSLPRLRECQSVFLDRIHAGRCISDMIKESDAVVLGIPAGGIPVAAVVARALGLSLDVAVVSKITLPWNTEAGYGAVAFDGSLQLNEPLIIQAGLRREQVQAGDPDQVHAVLGERGHVPGQRHRVARHVRDGPRPGPRHRGRSGARSSPAGAG